MLDRDFCLQKLDSAIDLIDRLAATDFPHDDSKNALEDLRKVHENDRTLLINLRGAANDTILEHCRRANVNIARLKKYVGMLLRSANLRNAFEIYFPIKVYAQDIFGNETSLVLSSEWEFSPFIYPVALKELPKFIFIGVPASECQNPLIVPLAGHELGHASWNRNGTKQAFDPLIRTEILKQYTNNWSKLLNYLPGSLKPTDLQTNRLLLNIWGDSYSLAQRQLEELFCDYYGLYLFGPAYLYAFRYLLAPSLGHLRSPKYPRTADRASFLVEAASAWGMNPDLSYSSSFSEQDPALPPLDQFILNMADATTEALRQQLIPMISAYIGKLQIYNVGNDEELRSKKAMLGLVPTPTVSSIAPIINASWQIRLDIDQWDVLQSIENPTVRRAEKIRVLRDLTLKSLEIYEYGKRLKKHAA